MNEYKRYDSEHECSGCGHQFEGYASLDQHLQSCKKLLMLIENIQAEENRFRDELLESQE